MSSMQPFIPVFAQSSRSLVKKYLIPELARCLQNRTTPSGFTMAMAIQDALQNPDSSIGIYAGDSESYNVLKELFDPIIRDYHCMETLGGQQTDSSSPDLANPDPENRHILSTRIRVARNIAGIPFTPMMTPQDRRQVEHMAKQALLNLTHDLGGTYTPLEELQGIQRQHLAGEHLLFSKGDRFQEAAGINRDWPLARGIFVSRDLRFAVWINEEDHLRIISIDRNGEISRTADRLNRALDSLSASLDFARSDRLDFLTTCPSNLGTGMRAGVHIRLPNLFRHLDILEDLTRTHQLQIRGTQGEKTGVDNAVFDISNKRRLGITRNQGLQTLCQGIVAIINQERELSD
ncbi:MAG: phosphagen kinase [Pseudomonadota bacterium]